MVSCNFDYCNMIFKNCALDTALRVMDLNYP